jgi:chromate transporter
MEAEGIGAGETPHRMRWPEVFLAFLRLGLTSFGGPIAHIGYFRRAFVEDRRWLDADRFAGLLALCQTLPGPASSQLGLAIGHARGGWPGALAAWFGFTLPSALLMILFAWGAHWMGVSDALLHGLKAAAIAVVAQAVLLMARQFASGPRRLVIAIGAVLATALAGGAAMQIVVILAGSLLGVALIRDARPLPSTSGDEAVRPRAAILLLALFAILLVASVAVVDKRGPLAELAAYYRVGALVFGGGHVVLPLLEQAVVSTGVVDREAFLAAYGAAQALPGPLFTIAAYPGYFGTPGGVLGSALAVVAIFLPGALLLIGVLPHWSRLTRLPRAAPALAGINAAVVGLLGAALYDPLWRSTVHRPLDALLAGTAFLGLTVGRLPPLLVVVGCAGAGWLLDRGL